MRFFSVFFEEIFEIKKLFLNRIIECCEIQVFLLVLLDWIVRVVFFWVSISGINFGNDSDEFQ
jgi:hypothetical protein